MTELISKVGIELLGQLKTDRDSKKLWIAGPTVVVGGAPGRGSPSQFPTQQYASQCTLASVLYFVIVYLVFCIGVF